MAASLEIALPALGGAALGLFYFGGLWYTLRRLERSGSPALLMLGSYLGRLAVCLPCFYLAVRGGHWERLLIVMAAFLAMRLVLVRRLGPRRRATASGTAGG